MIVRGHSSDSGSGLKDATESVARRTRKGTPKALKLESYQYELRAKV
jgi:hypothetical protein